jgi:hypothetical protein
VKAGQLLQVLNWVREGNLVKVMKGGWAKFMGNTTKRVEYEGERREERLKEDLEGEFQEVEEMVEGKKVVIFRDENEVKRCVDWVETVYRLKMRKKVFTKFLGLYLFTWPYKETYPDWPFMMRFTKYGEGWWPVLVKRWFLHTHDPWIGKQRKNNEIGFDDPNSILETREEQKILVQNQLYNSNALDFKKGKTSVWPFKSNKNKTKIKPPEKTQKHKKQTRKRAVRNKKGTKKVWIEIVDSDDENGKMQKLSDSSGDLNLEELIITNPINIEKEASGSVKESLIVDPEEFIASLKEKPKSMRSRSSSSSSSNSITFDSTYQLDPQSQNTSILPPITPIISNLSHLVSKYTPLPPTTLSPTLSSEIQFKAICSLPITSIFQETPLPTPTYKSQLSLFSSISACMSSACTPLTLKYHLSSLQDILQTHFRKRQKSYLLSSKEEAVGLYVIMKSKEEIMEGKVLVEVSGVVEGVFDAKTVLVWGLNNFGQAVLRGMFFCKKWEVEVLKGFAERLKEEGVAEVSLGVNEELLEAVREAGVKLWVEEDELIRDTKTVVEVGNWVRDFKGKEEAKKELEDILNGVSGKLDAIWGKYEGMIGYSKVFSKKVLDRYREWVRNNEVLLRREFQDVFTLLLEPVPINQKQMDEVITNIYGLWPQVVEKVFWENDTKKSNEEQKKENGNKDVEEKNDSSNEKPFSNEEKIFSSVITNYSPQISLKIITNYLLSKMWRVDIPNNKQINQNFIPDIFVKEPIVEENKADDENSLPNPLNWKTFKINPTTLKWACPD